MSESEIVYLGPELTDEEYEAQWRQIEERCSEIVSNEWYNGRINMDAYNRMVERHERGEGA